MNKKLIIVGALLILVSALSISVLIGEKSGKSKAGDINNQAVPQENKTDGNSQTDSGTKNNNPAIDGKIILFYGSGCPHCIKVEDFLEANNADQKITYEMKEVWESEDNHDQMMEKVTACGMNPSGIGVPFLWDGETGTCLIGEDQVMEFFQNKLNAAAPSSGQNIE